MGYNNGNGYSYNNGSGGYAPQGQPQNAAPQGGYPQQTPAQNYPPQGQAPQYGTPQGGYPQQAPAQNPGYAPAPNGSYGQAPQQSGYQQQGSGREKVQYSSYIVNIPENASCLEDTQVTVALNNIDKSLNLYIEQLTSKNNNRCVKFSFDLTMADSECSRLLGKDAVAPDHKIRFEALMAGWDAENFLKYIPHCSKTIVLMLRKLKLDSFTRRDGSSVPKVDCLVSGYFVVNMSSKYKAAAIKAANLEESKPYHVNVRKPKNDGGGAPAQAPYSQQSAPYGAPQGGYPQQAPAQNTGYTPAPNGAYGQPPQQSGYQQPGGNGYGYGAPPQNGMPGATQYGGSGGKLPF
ncbi:MAG: hypothetical protein IJJ43_06335 [Oscillospiraceae bacterium]|nr:hypothetical protein [Oscillospiraceae bacterium]MBQ6465866.1 hypothetical protein [Oscillospiraceae bacterium]